MPDSLKTFFIEELKDHYRELMRSAGKAEADAGEGADAIVREARRREEADTAVEQARLAKGHQKRRQRARRELEALLAFEKQGVERLRRDGPVKVGSMVDVSFEGDEGPEERTLFLLPVGAGTELHGPGGDGFVKVITPDSPMGRSLAGARVGDTIEIVVAGRDREWTVMDLS